MSRYINADKLIEAVTLCNAEPFSKASVYALVALLPDANVREITRGTWSEEYLPDKDPLFRRRWVCSACGDFNTYGKPPYCPYCGAEMEQE